MSFTADDPTFKGLLASLRQAQDTPPPPPVEAPAPAAGSSTDAATPASDLASLGRGGYTVPYELPPPVDGVYPTYAELEQTRSGSTPTDPRDRSAAASDSPAPSTLSTPGLPASAQQPAHQDPFATTSGGGQKPKDLRLLTFTQALPYLTRLADDPSFLALIRQLKNDQDALERRLASQRKELIELHKEAVAKARFRAKMGGQSGLTTFQQTDLADGLTSALAAFHRQQVIPTWDHLAKTQLDKLEAHGVPGLGTFQTEHESELGASRVRKILGVLEGALEDS